MTAPSVVIDANILVALVDARDTWHSQAVALRDALMAGQAQLIYFDCVVNETVGVIGRRAEEQKRAEQFSQLLSRLRQEVSPSSITWISGEGERLYEQVLDLCRSHEGRLNFNDSLMALFCREQGIRYIASYDHDFDHLFWLVRMFDPAHLQALVGKRS